MKKNLIIVCMVLMALPALHSCTKGFEDLNTDPIRSLKTSSDKLLAPALVNSIWPGMSRNRSFNNELMQVTVAQSNGDVSVFRYAFRANWSDYLWNSYYVQLYNFKLVDSLAQTADTIKNVPIPVNTSYQAIGKIGKVWLFSMLTDIYGDIPYFHALEGLSGDGVIGNVTPEFDRQKDIYLDMFKQLETANTLLAAGPAIKQTSDPVYNGDIAKWRKFANSLYLRLLLRISGKAEVSQQCIDKIKEITGNPAQYPIFQSNADGARILWNGLASTTDPYTSPYVTGVRAADFRAPGICSFFIDPLIAWKDPRYISTAPYGNGSIGKFGISQASGGGWFGIPSGYAPGAGDTKGCYFVSNDNTSTGGELSLQQNRNTGIIMQYAELQFILAEAAAKGWIDASKTEAYFNQGIASAINYWASAFPEAIPSTNFTTHMDNLEAAGIVWDNGATLEQKMEMIHLQKYYALFLTDHQQWFEYRRTGHPVLPKGQGLQNGGVMPARLVYPVYVQAANPAGYKGAVAAQGADEINTQVWWQRP